MQVLTVLSERIEEKCRILDKDISHTKISTSFLDIRMLDHSYKLKVLVGGGGERHRHFCEQTQCLPPRLRRLVLRLPREDDFGPARMPLVLVIGDLWDLVKVDPLYSRHVKDKALHTAIHNL